MAIFIGGNRPNIFVGDPFGVAESDIMFGNNNSDGLLGLGGADSLFGGNDQDRLLGGDGNDYLEGGTAGDFMDGGAGRDALSYAQSFAGVGVNLGTGAAAGGDATGDAFVGMEDLYGSGFDDRLTGDAGRNEIVGGDGFDQISGGGGRDTLRGDFERDLLTGGAGRDTFLYFEVSDSAPISGVDTITDFMLGMDILDLAAIDAVTATAADDAFTFIGAAAFSGTAGELRSVAGVTEGDVNGDGVADLVIAIGPALAITDIVL